MRLYLLFLIQLFALNVNSQNRGAIVENNSDHFIPGKQYAIIIGINKYKNLPGLNCAANDAQSIYQVFNVCEGFCW